MKVCSILLMSENCCFDAAAFLRDQLVFLQQILNRWFTSEPLKATLATDGVIGAMTSPSNPGSGWVTCLAHKNRTGYYVSVNAPLMLWLYGLALKVCAPASCDGGVGEGEGCMGLCGGRNGWSVSGHCQLCSILRCRHFH